MVAASLEATRAAIADALRELGWEWAPGPRGRVSAVWSSPVFRFRDDIEIETEEGSGGRTTVRVRSKSRVGHFDWGQNARHIRTLFRQIDSSLQVTGSG